MLHCLQFSSYRLLPVLRHKSKVAYSSSAVRPSSPANLTSNLENHASRSSNNEQALMGSISLCICPHCCNVLVETFTVHVTHRTTVLRKEVQMRTQKVVISFWHSDVPCLYYPTHTENKEILCTRAAVQAKVQWLSGPHKCSTFMCHTLCITVTASCYLHIF